MVQKINALNDSHGISRAENSILTPVLANYSIVYRIRLSDGAFTLVRSDEGVIESGTTFANFDEAKDYFVNNVAYELDREMLREELDLGKICKKLETHTNCTIEYRAMIGKVATWHEMIFTHLGKDEIIIGHTEKDAEILSSNIAKAMMKDYEEFYVVNLNTGQMKILETAEVAKGKPSVVNYSEFTKEFASHLNDTEKDYFESRSDLAKLQRYLAEEGKQEYFYRSPYYGDKLTWMKSEVYPLTWRNGVPDTAVIAASKADAIQVERMRLSEKLSESLSFTSHFLKPYRTAYYVDLNTNEAIVYKNTFDPKTEGTVMTRFFDDMLDKTEKVVMAEDKDRLREIFSPEKIRAELQTNEVMTCVFRDTLVGDERYVRIEVVPGSDNDHVAVGFRDISTDVLRDQEQQRKLKESLKEAQEANDRLAVLRKLTKSGLWSYEINENDEVVSARYENITVVAVDNVFTKNAMSWVDFLHPEDKERVVKGFMAAIHDHSGNTLYDETFRVKLKDGKFKWAKSTGQLIRHEDGTAELFGMNISIDDQIEELEARQIAEQRRVALISKMAGKDSVFIVDCEKNTFRAIHDRPDGLTEYGSTDDYIKSITDYIYQYTAESDRKMVLELVNPAYMLEHTKDDNEITARFKDTATGRYRYYEMKIVRLSENEVLMSISDCHDSMVESLAHARLIDEYDALYVLDIEHNEVVPVRSSRVSQVGAFKGTLKYDEVAMRFAETVDPKYKEDWVRFGDANYLKDYMSTLDHREYVYELPGTKIRMRRMSLDVIDRKNGDARTLLLSFMGIDDLRAQTILLHRELAEQALRSKVDNETISTLSSEYLSLYHLNLDTHKCKTYFLDEKKVPDTKKFIDYTLDIFELLHKFAKVFVHPDDRQFFLDLDYDYVRELFAHRKKFTYRYRRDYGHGYLWSEMDIIKYEERDEPAKMLVLGFAERDNVIKKEIEQRKDLADALKKVEEANHAKTTFLNNMSHDIRTPMNAIMGYTSMTQKYLENPERAKDYLGKISTAGSNLLKLINQVLDMSRIESGKIVLTEEPADVIDKAYQMTEIMGNSADVKNIEMKTVIKNVTDRKVFADAGRVNQLIINLLGNAVKYTPEGGHITYTVSQIPCDKPDYATYTLIVEDDGIGMSKEYLAKIFEPFSRENTSTVSKIQGTGLGMSIVRRLVDIMGGTIDIESEQGKGTKITVTLTFRLDKESADSQQPATGDRDTAILKGRHVLLVEDNEMNCEIAKFILEEHGMTVETADDGDVAVARIRQLADSGDLQHFDFILMDIQMPRMGGYEATRAIREIERSTPTLLHKEGAKASPLRGDTEGSSIPIIALSANAFAEDKKKSLEAGLDGHISKPIDVSELMHTLAKLTK